MPSRRTNAHGDRNAHWLARLELGASIALLLAIGLLVWLLWYNGQSEALQAMAEGRIATLDVDAALAPSPSLPPPASPAPVSDSPSAAPASTTVAAPPEAPVAPVAVADNRVDFSSPIAVAPGASLAAPTDALAEQTDLGPLPRVSKDGIKPWMFYGRDYTRPDTTPMIAVLVTGLGFSRETTESAVRLPGTISLSFSPYAPSGALWANSARSAGHEIFIELPAEPNDYPQSDPGPNGLLTGNAPQENLRRLRWIMTRMTGFAGLYLPPRERLTANADAAAPLLQFIASRGVLLVLGEGTLSDAGERILAPLVLPVLRADIYSGDLETIDFPHLLLQLEDTAHRQGRALLVVEGSPLVLSTLAEWAQHVEEKGYSLAPVSALARIPNS